VFVEGRNADGDITSVEDQTLGGTWSFTYDPVHPTVDSATDPFGKTATATVDPVTGDVTAITSAEGRNISVVYTNDGLVKDYFDVFGTLRTYTHDPATGNTITEAYGTGPGARLTTFGYTSEGYLASVTNAKNETTEFEHDALGRLTTTTLPDSREIRRTYDENGNLASIQPPAGNPHVFVYGAGDVLDEDRPPAIQSIDPNPESWKTVYRYNNERQLIRIEQPDEKVIEHQYDNAGRLETTTHLPSMQPFSGTETRTYYPTTGLVETVTARDGGTLTYGYLGSRLTSQTWASGVAGSVSRTLRLDGTTDTESVNGGHTSGFDYDDDGVLVGAGLLAITPDPDTGRPIATALQDGAGLVTTARMYNQFGELSDLTATIGMSGVDFVEDFNSPGRDALGRVTDEVEEVLGVSTTYDYFYDAVDRLVQIDKNNNIFQCYQYDDNSNRTSLTEFNGAGPEVTTYTYDDQDRLVDVTDPLAATTTYEYTFAGNRSSKTDASGTTGYVHDGLGRLVQVTLPGAPPTVIDYILDGEGRRIGKKVGGGLMQGFLYNHRGQLVAELDVNGAVRSRFIYGISKNTPSYMQASGIIYRIVSDHLDSPRMVVRVSDGAIVQRIDYGFFGEVLQDSNPGFQPFGFLGGLYDVDTGLLLVDGLSYDSSVALPTSIPEPQRVHGGDIQSTALSLIRSRDLSSGSISPSRLGVLLDTVGAALLDVRAASYLVKDDTMGPNFCNCGIRICNLNCDLDIATCETIQAGGGFAKPCFDCALGRYAGCCFSGGTMTGDPCPGS